MMRDDIIIKKVCGYTRIPHEIVVSKNRMRTVCEARQLISYLLQLYTKLTLFKVAELCGYKSHASPIRDRSLVPMFLETDKKFKQDYEPLILEVAKLNDQLLRESNSPNPEVLLIGDICWFWNAGMQFPILGTLRRFRIDNANHTGFYRKEDKYREYSFCRHAGTQVFPVGFKREDIKGIEDEPTDELFYEESLIASAEMVCTT